MADSDDGPLVKEDPLAEFELEFRKASSKKTLKAITVSGYVREATMGIRKARPEDRRISPLTMDELRTLAERGLLGNEDKEAAFRGEVRQYRGLRATLPRTKAAARAIIKKRLAQQPFAPEVAPAAGSAAEEEAATGSAAEKEAAPAAGSAAAAPAVETALVGTVQVEAVVAQSTVKIAYAETRDDLVAYAATTTDKVLVFGCRDVFTDIIAASKGRLQPFAVAPAIVAMDEAHMMPSLFDQNAYKENLLMLKSFTRTKDAIFSAENIQPPSNLSKPLGVKFVKWLCSWLRDRAVCLEDACDEANKVAQPKFDGLPEELSTHEVQIFRKENFASFWKQEMLARFVERVAPELVEQKIDFESLEKLCPDPEMVEKIQGIKRTREEIDRKGKDVKKQLVTASQKAALVVRDIPLDVNSVESVALWNRQMTNTMRPVQATFSALADSYLNGSSTGSAKSIMAALPGGMGKSLLGAFNVMRKANVSGGKAFVVAPYEMHQLNMAESFAEAVRGTDYTMVLLKKHAKELDSKLTGDPMRKCNVETTKIRIGSQGIKDVSDYAKRCRGTKDEDGAPRTVWKRKDKNYFVPTDWPLFLLTATPDCFNAYHTIGYGIKKFYATPDFLTSTGQILHAKELLTNTDVRVPDEFVDVIRREAEAVGYKVKEFNAERRSFLDQLAKTIDMCLRTTDEWRERTKEDVLAPMQNVWVYCVSNPDAEWQSLAAQLLCNTPEGRMFLRKSYFTKDPWLVPDGDFMKTTTTLYGKSNNAEITRFIDEQKGWGSKWGLRDERGPVKLMFAFCTRVLTTGINCDTLHAVWLQRGYAPSTWLQVIYRALRTRPLEDGKELAYVLIAMHNTAPGLLPDNALARKKAKLMDENNKASIAAVVGPKHFKSFMTSSTKSRTFQETHGLVMHTRLKEPRMVASSASSSSSQSLPKEFSWKQLEVATRDYLRRDACLMAETEARYLSEAEKRVTLEAPWTLETQALPENSRLIDRECLLQLCARIRSDPVGSGGRASAVFGKIEAVLST